MKFVHLIKLLSKIIYDPRGAFTSESFETYSVKLLNVLYYLFFTFTGGLSVFLLYYGPTRGYNLALLIRCLIMMLIYSFIVKKITVVFYYFILNIKNESNLSFKQTEVVLLPIIFLFWFINYSGGLLLSGIPITKIILGFVPFLWFNYMIFLLLRYKLRQSNIKSILLSIIPVILYTTSIFVNRLH